MDITVGKIVSWFFGVILIIAGLGGLTEQSVLAGLIWFATGLFLIPNVREKIDEEYGIHFSRWVVFLIAIIGLSLGGAITSNSVSSTVPADSGSTVDSGDGPDSTSGGESGSVDQQPVTNASVTIDRIETQAGNLYPTRVSVENTGDTLISPRFDLYVYDTSGSQVCSGSPMINPFSTLSAGESGTEEVSIGTCMIEEDGSYTLNVELLDSDYNMLDEAEKRFSIEYWGSYS